MPYREGDSNTTEENSSIFSLFMASLRSRCRHYIFALWFLLLLFSSANLSRRRLDVYHTSTHGVALVQI